MDTPLAKIRMSGWLFYHLKAQGFLHWGYNYWYKSQTQQLIDPFAEQAGLRLAGLGLWRYIPGVSRAQWPSGFDPLGDIWRVDAGLCFAAKCQHQPG